LLKKGSKGPRKEQMKIIKNSQRLINQHGQAANLDSRVERRGLSAGKIIEAADAKKGFHFYQNIVKIFYSTG
jgi:hypothetical protein